uniref:Large ribosomal subunit protein uL2 C-terminal domain-containing protein n=1 Tax=Arundo donax TaxID=35708 RepID=A0A0A9FML2_ARUDO
MYANCYYGECHTIFGKLDCELLFVLLIFWETLVPLGTAIHSIEITRGRGGQLARTAGAVAKLIAKEGKSATLRLPYGEVVLCRIVVQFVSLEILNLSNFSYLSY